MFTIDPVGPMERCNIKITLSSAMLCDSLTGSQIPGAAKTLTVEIIGSGSSLKDLPMFVDSSGDVCMRGVSRAGDKAKH